MEIREKISVLAEGFSACSDLLIAIGDETRQRLIVEMLKIGRCSGVRVCEITEKTNLSRPAVSHHLQIMKKAGIVKVRKEGTKTYYFFDTETDAFEQLVCMLQLATEISRSLPERNCAD